MPEGAQCAPRGEVVQQNGQEDHAAHVESLEAQRVTLVMQRAQGNVSAAARLAGRNRSDFHELLRRHGLHSGAFREGTGLDEN